MVGYTSMSYIVEIVIQKDCLFVINTCILYYSSSLQ